MDIDSKYSMYGSKLINWVRYDKWRLARAECKSLEYAQALYRKTYKTWQWEINEEIRCMAKNIMDDFFVKYNAGRPAAVRSVKYECLAKCKCRTWTLSKISENKIKRGNTSICKKCRGELILYENENEKLKVVVVTGNAVNEEDEKKLEECKAREKIVVKPGDNWKELYNDVNKGTIERWYNV